MNFRKWALTGAGLLSVACAAAPAAATINLSYTFSFVGTYVGPLNGSQPRQLSSAFRSYTAIFNNLADDFTSATLSNMFFESMTLTRSGGQISLSYRLTNPYTETASITAAESSPYVFGSSATGSFASNIDSTRYSQSGYLASGRLYQYANTVSATPFANPGFSKDLAVVGVPEPATWAMMIGGMGLVGGAMRRREVAIRFA